MRLEETLGAMSGMLNTLLDINEIDAGIVHAEIIDFPIEGLLDQLRDEFAYHAQARGLALRVVPCSLTISSDPRLLEQMIRNLVSNALKYTRRGKILLGCRRHKDDLSIEVWDTGIGIPDNQLQAIFDEYLQLDNPARERSRGLGLGLSIVQRLGDVAWSSGSRAVASRAGVRCSPSTSSCRAIAGRARQGCRWQRRPGGGKRSPYRLDPRHRGRSGCTRTAGGLSAGRGP